MLPHDYEEDQRSLKNSIQDVRDSNSGPFAASFEKPCKETAVEEFMSWFASVESEFYKPGHYSMYLYTVKMFKTI